MYYFLLLSSLLLSTTLAHALDVKLTENKALVEVIHQNKLVTIQRIQDQDHLLQGDFAKTSRKCPPFCIQPMSAGLGVTTVGQLEVFNFMENELLDETGMIIDTRTPDWHNKGTIPGSKNIPFNVFSLSPDDPQLIDAMRMVGAKRRGYVSDFNKFIERIGLMSGDKNNTWDFTAAKKLILWCNGPWCGQSTQAISKLVTMGYPAEKLFYYRGGMQVWQSLGLTVVTSQP